MPILAVTEHFGSVELNGNSSAARILVAVTGGILSPLIPLRQTMNSSPPCRAGTDWMDPLHATSQGIGVADRRVESRGDLAQQQVPGVVPERVVHLLEVVEIHEQQRHQAARPARIRNSLQHPLLNRTRFGSAVCASKYASRRIRFPTGVARGDVLEGAGEAGGHETVRYPTTAFFLHRGGVTSSSPSGAGPGIPGSNRSGCMQGVVPGRGERQRAVILMDPRPETSSCVGLATVLGSAEQAKRLLRTSGVARMRRPTPSRRSWRFAVPRRDEPR